MKLSEYREKPVAANSNRSPDREKRDSVKTGLVSKVKYGIL